MSVAIGALSATGAHGRPDNPFDPAAAELESRKARDEAAAREEKSDERNRRAKKANGSAERQTGAEKVDASRLGPFRGCFQGMAVFMAKDESGRYLTVSPERLPNGHAKRDACG